VEVWVVDGQEEVLRYAGEYVEGTVIQGVFNSLEVHLAACEMLEAVGLKDLATRSLLTVAGSLDEPAASGRWYICGLWGLAIRGSLSFVSSQTAHRLVGSLSHKTLARSEHRRLALRWTTTFLSRGRRQRRLILHGLPLLVLTIRL